MLLPIAIVTSFLVTFILIPVVIKVSRSVDLMDIPDRRKVHQISTPSMGGLGVFIGWVVAILISVSIFELVNLKFLLSGVFLIFILGLRDDISSLQARHKLAFQILAAVLVVFFGGIRIASLLELVGVQTVPLLLDQGLSVFLIVGLTNAFNLIDGIDGLLGLIGILASAFLGWAYLVVDQQALAILSLTFCGSLIAFLFYNWYPSRIFMGDTGSLITGFFISVMFLNFIPLAKADLAFQYPILSAPVPLAISFMILPIYDTSRVVFIRLSKGISPFVPDRNHIHHAMLRLGLNHASASVTLVLVNIAIVTATILLATVFQEWMVVVCEFVTIFLFGLVVDQIGKRKQHLAKSGQMGDSTNLFVSKSA